MLEYHDPMWLVQRAWSTFRLAALQDLIENTIQDLERIEPLELVDAESCGADVRARGNPVQEALRACIEELRDASGMEHAATRRAAHREQIRYYMSQESSQWAETFGVALDKYRHAASAALQRSFATSRTSGRA